jgi:hypothetical protein
MRGDFCRQPPQCALISITRHLELSVISLLLMAAATNFLGVRPVGKVPGMFYRIAYVPVLVILLAPL